MLQTVPHLLLALIAGYVVTVVLLLILTIALTTTRRGLVMKDGKLTRGYAIVLALFWGDLFSGGACMWRRLCGEAGLGGR